MVEWHALVEQNLLLATYWANKYLRAGEGESGRELCMDAATDGLMRAARLYQPDRPAPSTGKPVKFSTFASLCIRHAICRARQVSDKKGRAVNVFDPESWDTLPDREQDEPNEMVKQQAMEMLKVKALTDNERAVLRLFYIEGWDYKEIGQSIGHSRQRVYQMRVKGVEKLKRVYAQSPSDKVSA